MNSDSYIREIVELEARIMVLNGEVSSLKRSLAEAMEALRHPITNESLIPRGQYDALREKVRVLREALQHHKCPSDGSTDQMCFVRIVADGLKCTATEALAATGDDAK